MRLPLLLLAFAIPFAQANPDAAPHTVGAISKEVLKQDLNKNAVRECDVKITTRYVPRNDKVLYDIFVEHGTLEREGEGNRATFSLTEKGQQMMSPGRYPRLCHGEHVVTNVTYFTTPGFNSAGQRVSFIAYDYELKLYDWAKNPLVTDTFAKKGTLKGKTKVISSSDGWLAEQRFSEIFE